MQKQLPNSCKEYKIVHLARAIKNKLKHAKVDSKLEMKDDVSITEMEKIIQSQTLTLLNLN